MFSSRTNWNLEPNRLAQLLQEKRRRNEFIVDLTESNPSRCEFDYDAKRVLDLLSDPRSLSYDPHPKGSTNARAAVSQHYEVSGSTIDPDQVILTASTSEAYSFLLKLLCDPGNSILVPKPSYPLFEYLCQLNDVTADSYRLDYDGEWAIDLESLENQISKRTRAIILVHPNIPTGSFIKLNERAGILRIASNHNLTLIVDEVFSEFCFDENQKRVPSFTSTDSVLTFSLGGISKMLGLPQMKLSWMVASGPADIRNEALKKLEVIADTYLSVNTPIQNALPRLLQVSDSMTSKILKRVRTNFDWLRSAFSINSSVSFLHSEGGWYAILRLPGTKSDEEWSEGFLESCNILVHPGHFYSVEMESCVVLSLLPKPESFSDSVAKLFSFIAHEPVVAG